MFNYFLKNNILVSFWFEDISSHQSLFCTDKKQIHALKAMKVEAGFGAGGGNNCQV